MFLYEIILDILEMDESLDAYFSKNNNKKEQLLAKAEEVIELVKKNDEEAYLDMVRSLYLLLDDVFRNPTDKMIWNHEHPVLYQIRYKLVELWESGWIGETSLTYDNIPEDPEKFAKWLRMYCRKHRLHTHPLLTYVKEGTIDDFRVLTYFSTSFDIPQNDLYAGATIGLPDTSARIEISKNYWDEMGLGDENGCHTVWAQKFAEALELYKDDRTWLEEFTSFPVRCLERFVIATYVGHSRRNWLKVIGHLGATEIYDPQLNVQFVKIGRHFGLSDSDLEYHIQHIKLDAIHSADWLEKVVIPICQENPEFRFEIARGAELNMEGLCRSYDAIYEMLLSKQPTFI